MDEKKSESAWDELVEELGVEADPAAVERHQSRPIDLSSASSDKPVSLPKSQPSDWNALAGSLGLEVPPPADPVEGSASSAQESEAVQDKLPANAPIARESKVESVKSAQDTESKSFDELPELRSEFDKELVEATGDDDLEGDDLEGDDLEGDDPKDTEDVSTGMSGEAARTAFDSLFAEATSEWELPSGADSILDTPLEFSRSSEESLEEPSVETSESDSEIAGEETTERPKRRRPRRRRRGRGGSSAEAKPAETAPEAEDAESSASTTEDATVKQSQPESVDAEVDKVAKSGEKPRRRRPRRRGRRNGGESGAEATLEGDSADSQQVGDSGLDVEDVEDDEDDTDDGSANQQSSRQRANHRNLPTWADAIGGIVDANLELRSKSPNRSTSSRGRGRGGKGRRKKQG